MYTGPIGHEFFELFPPTNILVNAGDVIALNVRFDDIDFAEQAGIGCPNSIKTPYYCGGTFKCNYEVIFKVLSNNSYASFDELSNVNEISVDVRKQSNGRLYTSEPVFLYVSDQWQGEGNSIVIQLEIRDYTSTSTITQGSIADITKFHTWDFGYDPDGQCATAIYSDNSNLANNVWSQTPQGVNGVDYIYKIGPSVSGEYNENGVTEKFDDPVAGDIFTIDHIAKKWKKKNNVIDADVAAKLLFKHQIGQPNTWNIQDSKSEFIDTHALRVSSNRFTRDAKKTNKIGFEVNQYYLFCGEILGSAILKKRINYNGGNEFKQVSKDHSF